MFSLQQNWREQSKFCLDVREVLGKREGVGDRGERWPKQCMHIRINE
jgi:hypothetical protein